VIPWTRAGGLQLPRQQSPFFAQSGAQSGPRLSAAKASNAHALHQIFHHKSEFISRTFQIKEQALLPDQRLIAAGEPLLGLHSLGCVSCGCSIALVLHPTVSPRLSTDSIGSRSQADGCRGRLCRRWIVCDAERVCVVHAVDKSRLQRSTSTAPIVGVPISHPLSPPFIENSSLAASSSRAQSGLDRACDRRRVPQTQDRRVVR